jgi:glycosyltransferase involved in cell wall biosynthesis
VDKKAPHLTLLAFSKVAAKIHDARLVMVGDGTLWEACKHLADALGVGDKVEFPGPSSHAEVAATMRHARAFVQHSMRTTYGDAEGTPVAILEAGASGLPVVATRHMGIQDVVIHSETGLLVEEGDIEGMAHWMGRIAEEPLLAGRLGRAARERVASQFSMDRSICNLWRIIERAIAAKPIRN